jgi:hypothetical protein
LFLRWAAGYCRFFLASSHYLDHSIFFKWPSRSKIVPEISCWYCRILSGFVTLSGPSHFFKWPSRSEIATRRPWVKNCRLSLKQLTLRRSRLFISAKVYLMISQQLGIYSVEWKDDRWMMD